MYYTNDNGDIAKVLGVDDRTGLSEKISHWQIKSRKSENIIGFGAEILKDDDYEWTLEMFKDELLDDRINLRLIFKNWELNNNPDIVNFKLNPKLTKKLIKSLKKQLKAINRKKKGVEIE